MGKFNKQGTTGRMSSATSPVTSVDRRPDTTTHEGGAGYSRDPRSELFVLGVSLMANEASNSFYEDARERDERFASLVHSLALSNDAADRAWARDFLLWLRGTANIRTAALLGAVEYVYAQSMWAHPAVKEASTLGRQIVRGVALRADEPGELLAIYAQRHGRNFSMALKRGVADAAQVLYTQRSWMKWDSRRAGFSFADVLQLTHPKPASYEQDLLFKHILNKAHEDSNEVTEIPEELFLVANRARMESLPVSQRVVDTTTLKGAGMTWEHVSGWINRPLTGDEWAELVPTMGYMALLRNLRNMEQAGLPSKAVDAVNERLQDGHEVATSRQLPMRFLSAYRAVNGLAFVHALERALDLSMNNVPQLDGHTLILVDRSGSMFHRTSAQTELTFADSAALFGTALAQRAEEATLVEFGTGSRQLRLLRGEALLTSVKERFSEMGGTNTVEALREHLVTSGPNRHDRVIIVTDEQAFPNMGWMRTHTVDSVVPSTMPLYTWNLTGYRAGHAPSGQPNRHTFAGLSDASFRLIPLIEQGQSAQWPWTVA